MTDLTAIILTKNEEVNIANCIISIRDLAKRILVIDSFSTDKTVDIAEKLGAEVVYPERDMAIRLASRLENSRMLDFVQLSETINVTKMKVPDNLVGKTVAEVNLRSRFGLNILAVEKKGMVSDAIRPDYVFCAEDILYLCGHRDGLKHMTEWSGK